MIQINGKYNRDCRIYIDNVEESALSTIHKILDHPISKDVPVRIMPDVHDGKGSVIGFTMPLTDKIIPNIVGVDIGCFVKDTKVKLTDGRDLSFDDLIKEDKLGKTNFGYSKDDEGNICISKLINPRKTRSVKKIIIIKLDNNEIIRCTLDHIFYLLDGKEIKASDLKINDRLFPLYIKKIKDINKKLLSSTSHVSDDHLVLYNPNTKKYDFIHYLSDNYNISHNNYETKNKTIRHHVDFNKFNNDPTNIERLNWKDHWKIHSENIKLTNSLKITGFGKAWKLSRNKMSKMSSEKMKKLHRDDNFKKRHKIRSAKIFKEYCKSYQFKEQSKLAGKRGSKYLSERNRSKKGREKSKEIANRNYICPTCKNIIKSPIGVYNHIKKCDTNLEFKDFSLNLNHKIISIEIIDCETDVYCLTSEFYENFAISSGVFVHNCGMLSSKIPEKSDLDLKKLDLDIRNSIPMGFKTNENPIISKFDFEIPNRLAITFTDKFNKKYQTHYKYPCYSDRWLKDKLNQINCSSDIFWKSLSSLGGGNHFIEIGLGLKRDLYATVHSGSRNFGLRVCKYWQLKAIGHCMYNKKEFDQELKKIKQNVSSKKEIPKEINKLKVRLKKNIDQEMSYLEGEDMIGYLFDMIFAQYYAYINRLLMIDLIISCIEKQIPNLDRDLITKISSTHNYINFDDFVIRKGAISSYEGEQMVIPFNMRDGLLICEGKSNDEWNNSAPHGAGRIYSRSKAKEHIRLKDFKESMKGIESSSVCESTIDESPFAYKDSKIIEYAIVPTAEIIDKVKPLLNIKAK